MNMKTSLISLKTNLKVEQLSWEWFRTKTRFDTEAKDNSEVAYRESLFTIFALLA